MNQYDIWPGPDVDKVGWDAVLVRERYYGPNTSEDITSMFDSVGPPIHFESSFKGFPARRFTLQVCKGYNGKWSKEHAGRY